MEPDQNKPAEAAASSKKAMIVLLTGIALLLIVLIALLALLLVKDGGIHPNGSNASAQGNASKKPVRTVEIKRDNVKVLVYRPQQSDSNTTVNFSLKYDCSGCQGQKFVSLGGVVGYGFNKAENVYLLDNDADLKYNPIVDEKGNMLMSPSCSSNLNPNTSIDCFIAFTKVPTGTTVSLVIDSLKIDGIKVR